ncbi:MAG: ABC transporter permease [Bacteroidaceae bacterium]|nr:ABC transporter permease [Bacteroidaceae bacterium]
MCNLLNVFRRELQRMTSRRIYFVACVVLPLFSLVFMATIFGNGQMQNLPVGVVDGDNTSLSRNIIRRVDATPELMVTHHFANEMEAQNAIKRKEIYGFLYIPTGFSQKTGNNEASSLCYYYHNAMLGVGGELHSTFETLLDEISVTPIVTEAIGLGESESTITSFLMPVSERELPTYNDTRNYAIYLTQPFFFVLLQILLLLVTTYALGSESKFGTSDEWLDVAQGNIGIAVMGKLLPYTLIFIIMGIFANGVFFGWMKMPIPCSLWIMNGVTILFILATQALALFLYSIFPALSLIISVVSMFGSLGATLSGITFPVEFMDTPVYWASFLFPVRHFMEVVQSLLYLDGSFGDYWTNLVALLVFLILPIILLPRLKNALITHQYDTIE